MSNKPLILRERAKQDIDDAIEHYLAEAGESVALEFINAVERTRHRIGAHPGSGSPRYAHDLDIPGLRFHVAEKFPYLIFYIEREREIDVWRVLH